MSCILNLSDSRYACYKYVYDYMYLDAWNSRRDSRLLLNDAVFLLRDAHGLLISEVTTSCLTKALSPDDRCNIRPQILLGPEDSMPLMMANKARMTAH